MSLAPKSLKPPSPTTRRHLHLATAVISVLVLLLWGLQVSSRLQRPLPEERAQVEEESTSVGQGVRAVLIPFQESIAAIRARWDTSVVGGLSTGFAQRSEALNAIANSFETPEMSSVPGTPSTGSGSATSSPQASSETSSAVEGSESLTSVPSETPPLDSASSF